MDSLKQQKQNVQFLIPGVRKNKNAHFFTKLVYYKHNDIIHNKRAKTAKMIIKRQKNKIWYTFTVEHYLAVKKSNELVLYATA